MLGCLRDPILRDIRQNVDEKTLINVSEVADVLRAAAVLAGEPESLFGSETNEVPDSVAFEKLVRVLLERSRFDLLAPLLRNLTSEEQNRVRILRNENFFTCRSEKKLLERSRDQLGDLAAADPQLSILVDNVEQVFCTIQERGADTVTSEVLLRGWVERLVEFGKQLLNSSLAQFRCVVEDSVIPNKSLILQALDSGRVADAVFLKTQQSGQMNMARMNTRMRHSPWRYEALERFPSARESIHAACLSDTERRATSAGRLPGASGTMPEFSDEI